MSCATGDCRVMIACRRIDIPGINAAIEGWRPIQRKHHANFAQDMNVMRPTDVSHMDDINTEMSGFLTRFDRSTEFDAASLARKKPSLAFAGMDQPSKRVMHLRTVAKGIIEVGRQCRIEITVTDKGRHLLDKLTKFRSCIHAVSFPSSELSVPRFHTPR